MKQKFHDPEPEPDPPECCGSETVVYESLNKGNEAFITRHKYECPECGNKYLDPL